MKTKLVTCVLLFLFIHFSSFARQQQVKLIIEAKDTYMAGPDNLIKVDTLIMHDKSTIQFEGDKMGVLEAKYVLIGKKCTISSKGLDGQNGEDGNPGTDGQNGGSLSLVMNFNKLGNLTIDTRGGDGGNGENGTNGYAGTRDREETRATKGPNGEISYSTVIIPGKPGTDGTDATLGGNSGNGGNIMLLYKADGFIPNFNQGDTKENTINILNKAGRIGRTGRPGKGGRQSIDGVVKYSERKESQNGSIELVNLNQQAAN